MKLPGLLYSDGIRKHKQVKFKGLDHTIMAEDSALYDMRNLSSDDYPLLSVRPKRHLVRKVGKPNGLFYWKGLMWVDGTDLYFEGKAVGHVTDSRKTFGALGPYIVILPDSLCFNVESGEIDKFHKKWTTESMSVMIRFTSANALFKDDDAYVNNNTEAAFKVMANQLVTYSAGVNLAPDFSAIFNVGDKVRFTFSDGRTRDASIKGFSRGIAPVNGKDAYGNDLYYCYSKIIFEEGTFEGCRSETPIVVERRAPELRYLCEDGNRLWGCDGDTIYASKLGDPFNWDTYEMLETDSWTLTPASSGEFTGCINYEGYPTFFKEDRLYRVYGQLPSTFSVVDSPCLGVAPGCGDTLAMAWGSVFYLGTNGPMVYTGSLPRPMGQELGSTRFVNGCGGSDGLKYYASLADPSGAHKLYVYDVQKGLWHIEDDLEVVHFCRVDGDLYCLDAEGNIWILGMAKAVPKTATEEDPILWMAEFSDFTHDDPNQKGVVKLQLRVGLDPGSEMTVSIQFDSDGTWRNVRTLTGTGMKRSWYLPIIPRRCDHYRIRLEGKGRAIIYSLVRESYSGSERSAK